MEVRRSSHEQESHLRNQLIDWAHRHADTSGGQMQALDYNPENYPGQDGYYINGEPQSATVVETIATVAEPQFPHLMESLQAQEEQTQEITRIGELLKGGNNVLLVTNHSSLIDIAIAQAAFYAQLRKKGYEFESGIIINKMVSFLSYRVGEDLAPAAEVLKMLDDHIYLSYPRTESAKKSGIHRFLPNEVDRHNRHMREKVHGDLEEGSMLLAVAASGTTDKLEEEGQTVHMATMGSGTSKLLQSPRSYVVPTAVLLDSSRPLLEICEPPRVVRNETEAHEIMTSIARHLTASVEDTQFNYTTPQH